MNLLLLNSKMLSAVSWISYISVSTIAFFVLRIEQSRQAIAADPWSTISFVVTQISPILLTLLTLYLERRLRNAKEKREENEVENVAAISAKVINEASSGAVLLQKSVYDQQIAQIQANQLADRTRSEESMREVIGKLESLTEECRKIKNENIRLKRIVFHWNDGIKQLVAQFKEHNIQPTWIPAENLEGLDFNE